MTFIIIKNGGDAARSDRKSGKKILKLLVHSNKILRSLICPLLIEKALFRIDLSRLPIFPQTIQTGRMQERIAIGEARFIVTAKQMNRCMKKHLYCLPKRFLVFNLFHSNI